MVLREFLITRFDEGTFLGYASNKKAYRCYNLWLLKIVQSANVKIDDLKTQKIKHQKSTSDTESEEDEKYVNIQTEEERNEEIQDEDMDIEENDKKTNPSYQNFAHPPKDEKIYEI